MKYTIQNFIYNEETGESEMTATSEYGLLRATVKCCPEDKDIQNEWDAYRFCEYKIAIKFKKCHLDSLIYRANGAEDAMRTVYLNMLDNKQLTECAVETLCLIDNQVQGYYKQVEKARKELTELKNNYKTWCDLWLQERRAFRNKNEK